MAKAGGKVTDMDFGSIIAPHGEAEFFSDYWEKAPLHIPRPDTRDPASLLTLDVMNRLLTEIMFRADECKMAMAGEIVAPAAYLAEPGMRVMERTQPEYVSTAKLLGLFEQGATLVFSQLNQKYRPLQVLKEDLERCLSATVITNVFLSNRNSQGFSLHYDSHDVFVPQLHGHKIWSLHDSPIELPLKSQAFGSTSVCPGPLVREIRLEPGDVLYVPRGYFHEARTTDAVSLHLTIGVHPYLWADYLGDLVKEIAAQTPSLRRAVPLDFARLHDAEKEVLVRDALAQMARADGLGHLASRVHGSAAGRKAAAGAGAIPDHLAEILAVPDLSLQSRISTRNHAGPPGITARSGAIVVTHQGRSLQFPPSHGPMIEQIRRNREFVIGDLPGDLSPEHKIRFVGRLIGLGLLAVERKPASQESAALTM
jgi:bifunctional lysine-specific demethylase and histidyl-hydroxylase MINA